jgi:hypothetical protein
VVRWGWERRGPGSLVRLSRLVLEAMPLASAGRVGSGAAGGEAGGLLDGQGGTQVDPYGGRADELTSMWVDRFWPQKFQGPQLTLPYIEQLVAARWAKLREARRGCSSAARRAA